MLHDVTTKVWDVIVIGTGIGGGTIGRSLAEKGFSVLFLEKGPFGPRAEQQNMSYDILDPHARLIRGLWPVEMTGTINGQTSTFLGPLGAGVGGSSAFYAATLERPERHDIDETSQHKHPTGGWPVDYDSFEPYFTAAEQMYCVRGGVDTLSSEPPADILPPIPIEAGDESLMASFSRLGLHPYQLHLGVKALPGCGFCFGSKCPRVCKMDGRSAGVEPALATGNASILDMCEVNFLRADADQVLHVEAQRGGQNIAVRGRAYVLAAGGFGSPRLLLASRSEQWPMGLANGSDMVGRNMMFHLTEMIAVWPERGGRFDAPTRGLALRDFYSSEGQRYGSFQAMGVNGSYGEIVQYLKNVFDRSPLRKLRPLRALLRIPAYLASRIFGNAKVFVGIMEDLPYAENRVLLDPEKPERIVFEYFIPAELRTRRAEYQKLIKRKLKGLKSTFLTFQPNLNFAHVCGTLRFGNDPKTSVLDANCRTHEVKNLYVADASFMPTSTGINPSLTIAANALRIADAIAGQLRADPAGATRKETSHAH
ncbi:MAG: GMC family oxidoreductase [Candidatus Devosia phytovorans]|uniref:GMC family oxidoreductase n=1 Tax=Candidatus Devosia phytovorans TaxID=3121372 RepID=A0AAJ5VT79_9HYPH|nr:GMC family oxidoreductase [Devosia sp.]WEK03730.1 MAG: GMC family oxidoreductase [Devosia sp.]